MRKILAFLLFPLFLQGQDFQYHPAGTTPVGTDLMLVDQGSYTKKFTLTQLSGFFGGGGGGGSVSSVFGRTGAIVAVDNDYTLDQLAGVVISSPSTGQIMRFNGTNWVNVALIAADIPNLDASKITSGTFADARIASAVTWNAKQNAISLTTTGTSGVATFSGGTLNIPNYVTSPAGSSGQLQFNNAGSFGASNKLTWDDANSRLGIGANSSTTYITPYQSNVPNDGLLVSGSNLGVTFSVQNRNSAGFSGIEYMDNASSVKVFTGFSNSSGQEFRFNNVASGGYFSFITGGLTRFLVYNNGTIGLSSLSGTGTRMVVTDASGNLSPQAIPTSSPAGSNTEVQFNNGGVFGSSNKFTWDGTTLGLNAYLSFSSGIKGIKHNGVTVLDFAGTTASTNGFLMSATSTSGKMETAGDFELQGGAGKFIRTLGNVRSQGTLSFGSTGAGGSITNTGVAEFGDISERVGTGTAVAKVGGVLKTFTTEYTQSSIGTQTVYSYAIPANTLVNDGDAIIYELCTHINNSTAGGGQMESSIRVAGTTVFKLYTASTISAVSVAKVKMVRTSSTTAYLTQDFNYNASISPTTNVPVGGLTGLDFTASITIDSQIFTNYTNVIKAKFATIEFKPANP